MTPEQSGGVNQKGQMTRRLEALQLFLKLSPPLMLNMKSDKQDTIYFVPVV